MLILNTPGFARSSPVVVSGGGGGATEIYSLTFTGDEPDNMGAGDPNSEGAFILFAGTGGAGWEDTNITTIDVTDDSEFPGTIKALRDTYFGGGTNYTFANQTAFFFHPDRPKFYMRGRFKWSSDWEWGNDQLKFCKNTGDVNTGTGFTGISTNCPKFDGDGDAHITKYASFDNSNEKRVYAKLKQAADAFYEEDDINNEFGGAGVDANWSPTLDEWYWIEWEVDAVSAGSALGYYKMWIDGDLYISREDVQISEVNDPMFNSHQLGHVWQHSSPTTDITLDFHSIQIFSEDPGDI